MSSSLGSRSSLSEGGIDERKRRRMQSNKESARRSRMRKQQLLGDLMGKRLQLKNQNSHLEMQINLLCQGYLKLESENSALRTQLMDLTNRLQLANSTLRFINDATGMAMDIPEMPEQLLEPWQLPYAAQPAMAMADMFNIEPLVL